MKDSMRLIAFLAAIIIFAASFGSCNESTSPENGYADTENTSDIISDTITEETAPPEPEKRIVRISIDYTGKLSVVFSIDDTSPYQGISFKSVSRVIFKNAKSRTYGELRLSDVTGTGGSGFEFTQEGDKVEHLIIVFKKGYKLTDQDKEEISEHDFGYMLES